MYRHPNIPGIAVPLFEASSIADLLSSKQQVAEAAPRNPFSLVNYALDASRLTSRLTNTEYVFPSSAFVVLPNVRHGMPEDDSKLSRLEFAISCIPWASEVVKLTLTDSTGKIDAYLPDEPLRGLMVYALGSNIGGHLKELDWTADVILLYQQATLGIRPEIMYVNKPIRGSRRKDYAMMLIQEAIRAGVLGSVIDEKLAS